MQEVVQGGMYVQGVVQGSMGVQRGMVVQGVVQGGMDVQRVVQGNMIFS